MTVMEKLKKLRQEMAQRNIDAYIVPTEDFHASEYVGDYFKTREYLSGFTGSAGTLLVMREQAALWTDGRYFLQAARQLEGSSITLMRAGQEGVPSLEEFLKEQLPQQAVVGFDGRTVSSSFVKKLSEILKEKQVTFAGQEDLADLIWEERPQLSKKPVWELETTYSGWSREEKLSLVREKMAEQRADVLLVTALDEIAWLLNLRGDDVLYTPVFLSYLLLFQKEAVLCIQEEIVSQEIKEKLAAAGVRLAPYEKIEALLGQIPEQQTVWLDEKVVSYRLVNSLSPSITCIHQTSPIILLKARKTPVEQRNIEEAHRKDGVAVTRFIRWMKEHAADGTVTELRAAEKLEEFRGAMAGYLAPSFAPIIAYGTHGAIVHYAATEETSVQLKNSGFCLVDIGGHYREGTTDITRTVALGKLTEEEKRMYTLVLRGHLNLGAAVFLQGVCGQNLDVLARGPLWENGLDFNHGTGHGVGYLLNVHEGPQRFHWRINGTACTPFYPGMVISDEPGLYLEGKFGIRLENLLLCCTGVKNEYGQFLHFKNLTMVPFDRNAIEPSLMTDRELTLLNQYHKMVYEVLAPRMTAEEKEWLKEATDEIKK